MRFTLLHSFSCAEKSQGVMEHTFRLELLVARAMLLQNTWLLKVWFNIFYSLLSIPFITAKKHLIPFLTGRLTSKSKVYSFGIVLREMLSGKRAMVDDSIRRQPSELG